MATYLQGNASPTRSSYVPLLINNIFNYFFLQRTSPCLSRSQRYPLADSLNTPTNPSLPSPVETTYALLNSSNYLNSPNNQMISKLSLYNLNNLTSQSKNAHIAHAFAQAFNMEAVPPNVQRIADSGTALTSDKYVLSTRKAGVM